ncbi:MAG: type 4a pilus biogenesis protein PilO [Candidatus Riflebacteria bacterium]|nr:type 4a pilus biogenesis protein PilO [Candidatus Riflebacteria bacterium]
MKTKLQSTIERVITYAVILITVLVMIYYFGTYNKRKKEESIRKNKELATLNQQYNEAEKMLETRKAAVQKINNERKEKEKEIEESFDNKLRRADSYTKFIEQVQRKAKALDIIIQNSTYDLPAKSETYLECKFSATVSGQYNKVKRFLWEVENAMGWFVKVSNVEIVPPISDKQGNMTLKLTLSTFFSSSTGSTSGI